MNTLIQILNSSVADALLTFILICIVLKHINNNNRHN